MGKFKDIDIDNLNKKAKWLIIEDKWCPYCSNCGEEVLKSVLIISHSLPLICPKCNCKMENWNDI